MKRNSSSKPPTRAGARNLFVSKGTLATFIRIGARHEKMAKEKAIAQDEDGDVLPGLGSRRRVRRFLLSLRVRTGRAMSSTRQSLRGRYQHEEEEKWRLKQEASVTSAREKPSSSKRRIRIARRFGLERHRSRSSQEKSQPCTRNSRRNCATCATAANCGENEYSGGRWSTSFQG